jgi:regulator of replication initiation timing
MKKEIFIVKTENFKDKTEITNMKKEIIIVKTENNNLKIDNNNLQNRIDILETLVNIPLSVVEGSDRSRCTLTNDSVLFNGGGSPCSVFLNRIIQNVSFFFCFFMIICLRVFIIGLFIGLFIYLLFIFSKSEFSFTPDPTNYVCYFGIVDSNRINECFNSGIYNNNSFFFFLFFYYILLYFFFNRFVFTNVDIFMLSPQQFHP